MLVGQCSKKILIPREVWAWPYLKQSRMRRSHSNTNYALGSVLNHVCLHQTIIGQECREQLAMVDDYPDVVIGCVGGGSNFAGHLFPVCR